MAASLCEGCLAGDSSDLDDAGWFDADANPADGGSEGRTFYVSPSGDDTSSGQVRDQAWRSLARVNRESFAPGDVILLEGGATFEGTLQLDERDGGDPRKPVRVSSFGEGRARIEAGAGDAIRLSDVTGVRIEQLILSGGWLADAQAGNEGEGVNATATEPGRRREWLRLHQLEISGFKLAGIGLHARPPGDVKDSGYDDVEISDCHLHDNGDVGLLSDGPYIYDGPGYSHSNVRVLRVRAGFNRGIKHKGEHTGSGIVLSDVDGASIEHSIAHDNGEFNDHAQGGGFGIWAWDSNDVVIQFNEAYANRSSTADGGGFDLDGGMTNSVVQYNYSHDNQGAGYGAFQFAWARPFSGNLIRYNISQDDGFAFLAWDGNGDMGSVSFAQNVGYGPNVIVRTYSSFEQVRFANNVFYATGPTLADVYDGRGLELQGNAYWSEPNPLRIVWGSGTSRPETFSDFAAYREATGQETRAGEATGVHTDPGLVAAGTGGTLDDTDALTSLRVYQLAEDSPLVDRGIDLTALGIDPGDRDFFAGPAPQGEAADIGVHELR